MDKEIAIPDADMIALQRIAPDAYGLSILIVNAYAFSQPSGDWMLVACGLPLSTGRTRRWAEEQFGKNARPQAILLTHGYFDHTGEVDLSRVYPRGPVTDAFATTKQESFLAGVTQPAGLYGPPSFFTTDWDATRESVKKLAALRPSTVAAGHGHPLSGADVADSVGKLANGFDVIARPQHGRYVNRPAA